MAANILLTGNIIFIKVDYRNSFIPNAEAKYVIAPISGGIFSDAVYTESEIKGRYPEVKDVKSFLDVKDAWNKHP